MRLKNVSLNKLLKLGENVHFTECTGVTLVTSLTAYYLCIKSTTSHSWFNPKQGTQTQQHFLQKKKTLKGIQYLDLSGAYF